MSCSPANLQDHHSTNGAATASSQGSPEANSQEASSLPGGIAAPASSQEEPVSQGATPESQQAGGGDAAAGAEHIQTVACIGDSITYGYGLGSPETKSWPSLLREMLGGECQVVNLGVSGTTLSDTGEYPYRRTGNIEVAKELQPDVLFIMLGSNDVLSGRWDSEAYRAQLESLAEEMTASCPQARIVLMTPPCTFYGSIDAAYGEFADEAFGQDVRTAVRDVAAQNNAVFVDLFELTQGHPEWFPDCLHPNEAGHQAMAEHIYAAVFG